MSRSPESLLQADAIPGAARPMRICEAALALSDLRHLHMPRSMQPLRPLMQIEALLLFWSKQQSCLRSDSELAQR